MCHGVLRVPPLRRVTFGKRPKSNQKVLALPYGRLAKARRCPHSGTVMGARRDGPSMAHRGWRGVLPRHPHNSTCVRPSVMGPSGVWNISVAAVGLSYKLQTRRKPLPDKGLAIKSEFTLRFLRILWYKMRRFAGIARRAQTHTRVDTMTWVPSARSCWLVIGIRGGLTRLIKELSCPKSTCAIC